MARAKVTLTLTVDNLEELRTRVGARSLSAAVDAAVSAYLARMRHLSAVDQWLAELERAHGPIPPETLDWAVDVVDTWATGRSRQRRRNAA
ncbi:MAG: CopG family transcriptional regulator [Deltaproteobacteria bacterium]|nr:CopG family transcriptional regulator [Deltaproteobacteria bacterium]